VGRKEHSLARITPGLTTSICMVHESVFVTCGNTAPYFYRLFFSIENKSEGDVRKNSEQGSDGW
jgi:hypothetical protein